MHQTAVTSFVRLKLCRRGPFLFCNMAITAITALRALRRPVCGALAPLLSHSFLRSELQGVEAVEQWPIFGRELLDQAVRRSHFAVRAGPVPEAALVPLEIKALVDQVKTCLELERADLPTGKNGRDDEDLLLWFLRDRNFDIDAAVVKLIEALEWRRDFGIDEITEASVSKVASIGKAYLHESPANDGKPVIIVISTKHFPNDELLLESQKHCVYLIEKALKQIPAGGETFLGIFDLRGFQQKNGDLKFVKFLIDVFFKYYPKRLGEVLLVDAPFIFEPWWRMMKPLFGKYTALVRFCSVEDLRNEYFTPDTIPDTFKQ